MKKTLFLLASGLFAISLPLFAQKTGFQPGTLSQIAEAEAKAHAGKTLAPTLALTDDYDVKYHRLEWQIDPSQRYIKGAVTTYFESAVGGLLAVHFDLMNALQVDSVRWRGQTMSFAHHNDILTLWLSQPMPIGKLDSVTVFYQGVPADTGFGSFEQSTHAGAPIVWTLSEPYGARDWWPCKQNLGDKIDSIDVLVTCPTGNRAASNGLLVAEKNNPATNQTTFHWRHRYPIACYLVAIAVTNYAQYTDQAELTSGPLPILNYVFPENLASAQGQTPDVVPLIEFYDSLFVPYPFRNEKYGHAQFGWGGGMEHQTMSFMANFGYELMAHELAHQWFGDHVTCGSWADIWLNEGFATYLSGLCYERFSPAQYWPVFKQQRLQSVTSQPGGSVFVDDTTNVNRIFSGRLSYAKGAMVLHQLRWAVGDEAFFSGLRNYLNDNRLAGNFARTADLRTHLEATSGQPLDWYFNDWIFGQGHPSYQLVWSQAGSTVSLQVNQTQSHPSVGFFEMPLPLRFKSASGQTFDARPVLSSNGQAFQIENVPFQASELAFDSDLWLISANNTVTKVAVGTHNLAAQGFGLRIEPNPATGGTVRAVAVAPVAGEVHFSIENLEGRTLFSSAENLVSGENRLSFAVVGLPAGTYFLRMKNTAGEMATPVIIH